MFLKAIIINLRGSYTQRWGREQERERYTHRYTWRKRHTERNRDLEKHRHTETEQETDKKVRKGLVGKQGCNVRGRNMKEDDGGESDQNSLYT